LEQVKALLAVREQFVTQNTAHKNALRAIQRKVVRTPFAEQSYLQLIEQLKKQIQAIDSEVRRLIESDPTFKEMLLLLLSVPGVGLLLAAHFILLAQFSLEYKVLASFLGISPNEHSSGSSVFKHATSRHFGPPSIRKLLYLAACSIRHVSGSQNQTRQTGPPRFEQRRKQTCTHYVCRLAIENRFRRKLSLCSAFRFSKFLDKVIVFAMT
jgi:transposase